jgi:hypothetical protein
MCLEFDQADKIQLLVMDILMIFSVKNNKKVLSSLFYLQSFQRTDSMFTIILKILNKSITIEGKELLLESALTLINSIVNSSDDPFTRILMRRRLHEKGFTEIYRSELENVYNDFRGKDIILNFLFKFFI